MEKLCLVGQGSDGPIHSWTKSHSYLCSGHSRDPITAIHTWQALKTHKEAHCLLETHSSALRYFLKFYFELIVTLKNVLDDYCSRHTVSPLDPGRPGIPLEPWAPCRAKGKGQTSHAQLSQCLGLVKEVSIVSGWCWKSCCLWRWTPIWTHSVSLGTCFSWRSSLSLITLYENKMLLL